MAKILKQARQHMTQFNEGLAEERRFMFRLGVHVNEIIVVERASHDVFGDGVNLTERIQVLTESRRDRRLARGSRRG